MKSSRQARRARRALQSPALCLCLSLAVAGAALCPSAARAEVELGGEAALVGGRGPAEVRRGERLELRFELRGSAELLEVHELFVHLEREVGAEPRCRMVRDVRPELGAGERRPDAALVEVLVDWPEVTCPPGVYDIFVGLWNPETGRRLPVLGGRGDFDRVRFGRLRVVGEGAEVDGAIGELRPLEPPPPPPFTPPWSVIALFLLAALCAVCAVIVRRRAPGWGALDERRGERGVWSERALAAIPIGLLGWGITTCLGFVKDDAYISFRYAHNLASGRGMVFNAGERVEGYTNFLWTVMMVPFDALGADLVQVCDVLGPLFSLSLILLVIRASSKIDGQGPLASHLWAATWLASSSSLALWSVGGLEQSLAALLPFAGALSSWRGVRDDSRRWLVVGGLLFAAACLTRPEGHLFVLLIALFWLASRRADRLFLTWLAPIVIVLLPYHLWRSLYFGGLLPNTYLVKAVSGEAVYRAGFRLAADLLAFNATGLVIVFALLSLLIARGREVGLWRWGAVILALLFVIYEIKVGTDELMWHRLFLPALPFVAVAAATGLRLLATTAARSLSPRLRLVPYIVGWIIVGIAAWHNTSFTAEHMRGTGYESCTGANHPDLGKFLTRHGEPGDLVAFQDMGATPFHAPDLRFLDLVGLVNPRIAAMYQRHGVHPFVGATRARGGSELCLEFRDHLFERDPEWVVLVPWPDRELVGEVAEAFGRQDSEALLRRSGSYANTQFDCHLYEDPRFAARYVHVRTWMRSPLYYLSTFLRRDRWQRAPPEVVLDAPPPSITGPRVSYVNGVELLGGLVEEETVIERQEVFVTTWWRAPGPLSEDLQVFLHLESVEDPELRGSLDHPPGDWMYPASRWAPGEIIEDRVLVQLPPALTPGRYEVHVGLFDRRTGARVETGGAAGDEQHRVRLGTLRIRRFRHFLDPIIPRTRGTEQAI